MASAFFGNASYFSDPSLTPTDLEKFFRAAELLWAAHPWTLSDDEALVQIELPAMGIEDACVTIVGSLGEVRGFAFFPSYQDYERATELGDGDPDALPPPHRALYFSFDAKEDVPESMRQEVAEHGWPITDQNVYPVLVRMADGEHAPVHETELKLATAITRALGAFVPRHAQAFENYGHVKARESVVDENGLELVLSVPHPEAERTLASELPPRAMTLAGSPNPYALPLDAPKLSQLERTLGGFTLHRVLGLFCAVLSVPELPRPGVWLGEIMQHVTFADDAQARSAMDLLMVVYNHVVSTLDDHEIDRLIPEAGDVEACAEWARGYTGMLGRMDPTQLKGDVLDAAFAIQVLAEVPQMLELLEKIRGENSREAMLAEYRESLADDADLLLEAWADARAHAVSTQPQETVRREGPKVGRNDPCPCGSGKKYKKCCATP